MPAQPESAADRHDFAATVEAHGLDLRPLSAATLQVNVTRLCNQACRHCHVDASPARTEQMDSATADRCLELLARHESITTLDITGGAPELNPCFERLVVAARRLGRHVIVRHNLTITLDGHPVTGEPMDHLPAFFAEHAVELMCSLPYYQEFFTDRQRGDGVFDKSIESLHRLNAAGYGVAGRGLELDLVYNPAGAFLPPDQASLEADYRRELKTRFGIMFTRLLAIANLPVHRFRDDLARRGTLDSYMSKLTSAFNPAAAEAVMCRSMLSVGHDGRVYDCDFNQMLNMQAALDEPVTVFNFDLDAWLRRRIRFGPHCFGCTAGAGSSCGGATA